MAHSIVGPHLTMDNTISEWTGIGIQSLVNNGYGNKLIRNSVNQKQEE